MLGAIESCAASLIVFLVGMLMSKASQFKCLLFHDEGPFDHPERPSINWTMSVCVGNWFIFHVFLGDRLSQAFPLKAEVRMISAKNATYWVKPIDTRDLRCSQKLVLHLVIQN